MNVILLKGCTGGTEKPTETFDYENALLNAGKNYFENNKALRHMNGGAMQIGRGQNSIIRYNLFNFCTKERIYWNQRYINLSAPSQTHICVLTNTRIGY